MGDEHHRRAGRCGGCRAAGPASPCGSVRRARRTARPSGAATAAAPARGRARRAASCRRRAGAAGSWRRPESPTRSSSSSARFFAAASLRPAISIGNSTLASTVRHGSRFGVWNTKPKSSCGPSDLAAADFDAAAARARHAGDDAQQRGLAAAARAEQRDELALLEANRRRLQRDDLGRAARGAGEALADADRGRRTGPLPPSVTA